MLCLPASFLLLPSHALHRLQESRHHCHIFFVSLLLFFCVLTSRSSCLRRNWLNSLPADTFCFLTRLFEAPLADTDLSTTGFLSFTAPATDMFPVSGKAGGYFDGVAAGSHLEMSMPGPRRGLGKSSVGLISSIGDSALDWPDGVADVESKTPGDKALPLSTRETGTTQAFSPLRSMISAWTGGSRFFALPVSFKLSRYFCDEDFMLFHRLLH